MSLLALSGAASAQTVFESSWNRALGVSQLALSDGGRWEDVEDKDNPGLIRVIPDGVAENNALRVRLDDQADPHLTAFGVGSANVSDWYWRVYVKVHAGCVVGNLHGIQHGVPSIHLYVGIKASGAVPGFWQVYMFPHTFFFGEFAGPDNVLELDRYYRFESHWHFVTPGSTLSDVQIEYRVYDDQDILLFTENEMTAEYTIATLASASASGVLLADATRDDWFMGNNGPASGGGPCDLYDVSAFASSNAGWLGPATPPDWDADGVKDSLDNCRAHANASQCDTDADGYGNRCDADFNEDGMQSIPDLTQFLLPQMNTPVPPANPDVDMTCDGIVGIPDLTRMIPIINSPPGPSGRACANPTTPGSCPP